MKRLFLIPVTFFLASVAYGQDAGTTDNAFFRFDNAGSPKEISKLGTAPEFPFLRNMSSSRQLYAAIERNDKKGTEGMDQLNDLLMAIGFSNGAKDLDPSNISSYYVPSGTEGNMGSRGYTSEYAKLSGDASEFKAWKISGSAGFVYIMAKCGNAFFPKSGTGATACVTAPVNLTGDMSEVTLNSDGQKTTTTDVVYVYYARKRHKRHETANAVPGIADAYPSKPLMLRSTKDVQVVPETYKISLSTPDNTVSVCPDSTLNLTANINVEKTSAYTGNYPDKTNSQYKKVSKREYKRIARNVRKIDRRERRVARWSGVKMEDDTNA